ncbi:MAG: hypothetical protein A4E63_00131 [Syntrophorhabdus sp. PtaU1.Bin050]|nr:MAG: hypothetical protein A4E63_00131 [Syntrophorhabdus sp. PtaU1.Bin050]
MSEPHPIDNYFRIDFKYKPGESPEAQVFLPVVKLDSIGVLFRHSCGYDDKLVHFLSQVCAEIIVDRYPVVRYLLLINENDFCHFFCQQSPFIADVGLSKDTVLSQN